MSERQYIYVLKLIERLHEENAWTDNDNRIITAHFNHLKNNTESGKVILAGKTDKDSGFGIVLFNAASEDEAERFMNSDPAIMNDIMSGELHPFHIALRGK